MCFRDPNLNIDAVVTYPLAAPSSNVVSAGPSFKLGDISSGAVLRLWNLSVVTLSISFARETTAGRAEMNILT